MQTKTLIGVGLGIFIIFIGLGIWMSSQPGKLDAFAQCLADEGATFYGAFWCPHCQEQKAMFGRSERLLPYTECSLPSGQGQTQVCIDAGITSYPTWQFKDETREEGTIPLATLAERTGCELPQ